MTELSAYVPGQGPRGAKLAVIGIAPGREEVLAGEPFVGPSGYILNSDLKEAGVNPKDVYKTNIFKHQLPDNEFKRYQEIGLNLQEALADLTQEIYALNPNCILGLGDPVIYSLAGKSGKHNGINVWRGSILQVLGRKAVFTWHPAHELHTRGANTSDEQKGTWKSWQKYVRKFDVKRAVDQSEFSELRLPQRLLHTARSSADVYRYLEKNENEEYCAVDIESIEGIPVCIGLSFRHHEGFCIPLWNTLPIKCFNEAHPKKSYSYNLKVSEIPVSDLAFIWKMLAEFFLGKTKFIGQNFKYDEEKLNRLGFYLSLHWDIIIGTHCISSEMLKSLAFQTSIYTEEPYYKSEGKNFTPGKDNIEIFFNYNCKDACVTREIFDVQMEELKQIPYGIDHASWRMKLHPLYRDIDRVGFKTDEIERKVLIHKYIGKLIELEIKIKELTGEIINPASPKQVDELLYDKLKIPRRKGTGEQILTGLIGNVLNKKPEDAFKVKVCESILDWRRVNKSLGYLQAEPDYDGRMKTTFLICGTENYRTSTNALEQPIRPDSMGWAFQTVSKHGDIGQDLRTILEADLGYVILNLDQEQAEARVCSRLANDEETLISYDTIDKHALTASKFFGGKEEQYSKKILGYECPERFVGKTLRHAYHLGIGKHEAMINVNTDARKYRIPISISEWRADQCLKILASDTPKIQTVFHETIQELLRKDRRIIGTFGASRYFYDAAETKDLWKGAYSFIPQQTVSDNTKRLMLKIKENLWDIKMVVESHDAVTCLVPEARLHEVIEEIREYTKIPIDFSACSIKREPLTIPWDFEIGYNYKDLKKYVRKAHQKIAS